MATEFLMPKLGLTMEEGTITEWFADDGTTIAAGDPLLRIETDKTETDVEAAATGRLHRVGQVGDTFACGDLIGWFLADDEAPPAGSAPATSTAAAASTPPPASAAPVAAVSTAAPATAVINGGRIVASPLTKRLAGERNIDLRTVRGTGPGGRIIAADLDDLPAAPPAAVRPPALRGIQWHACYRSRAQPRRPARCRPRPGVDRSGRTAHHERLGGAARSRADRQWRDPRHRKLRRPPWRRHCRRRPVRFASPACEARSPSGCTSHCARWRS